MASRAAATPTVSSPARTASDGACLAFEKFMGFEKGESNILPIGRQFAR
jgi:hypothetical protein